MGRLELCLSCVAVVIVGDSIDGVSELVLTSSFPMSFDEHLFAVSFIIDVYFDSYSVLDFILTSFVSIFFDYNVVSQIFYQMKHTWLQIFENTEQT